MIDKLSFYKAWEFSVNARIFVRFDALQQSDVLIYYGTLYV